jgi:hypothetical protein
LVVISLIGVTGFSAAIAGANVSSVSSANPVAIPISMVKANAFRMGV